MPLATTDQDSDNKEEVAIEEDDEEEVQRAIDERAIEEDEFTEYSVAQKPKVVEF